MKLTSRWALLVILAAHCTSSFATPMFFNSRTLFDSAVADQIGSDVRSIDFEGIDVGQALPVGSQLQTSGGSAISSVTLEYVIGDGSGGTVPSPMKVTDLFDTTSGQNYLGIDDPGNFDQFVAGQIFNLLLGGPFNALGMYFITGDPLLPGDIMLQTDVGTATTNGIADSILGDGSLVYFLGVVSPDLTFGRGFVRFGEGADGAFLYNVDDIVIAKVPEPGTAFLVVLGLLILSHRRVFLGRGSNRPINSSIFLKGDFNE